MTLEKGLETLIVLTLAALIAYFTFNVNWLLYLAIVFLVIAIVSKKLTILVGKVWFSFSHYLGLGMNYILMFLIFYLILTPLSFFQRVTGNNELLKKGSSNDSYFHQRNHWYVKKDIEKPW